MTHLSHLSTNLKIPSRKKQLSCIRDRSRITISTSSLPRSTLLESPRHACAMFVQTLRVIGLTGSAFITRANVNSVETDHHFTRTPKIRQPTIHVTELHHYAVNYNSVPTPTARTNVFSTAQGQQKQKAGNYRDVYLCIHTLPNMGLCQEQITANGIQRLVLRIEFYDVYHHENKLSLH